MPAHATSAVPYPIARVLRSGEPVLFAELPADVLRGLAGDCQFSSGLVVPLVTRSGAAGVITCLARPGRAPFDTRDLNLAQDLARRCSMAIDNAQLYREAREAISIRDEFLSVAAHELKTPMTSLRGYAQLLGREFEKGDAPDAVFLPWQLANQAAVFAKQMAEQGVKATIFGSDGLFSAKDFIDGGFRFLQIETRQPQASIQAQIRPTPAFELSWNARAVMP